MKGWGAMTLVDDMLVTGLIGEGEAAVLRRVAPALVSEAHRRGRHSLWLLTRLHAALQDGAIPGPSGRDPTADRTGENAIARSDQYNRSC
jgi:hypothetical protein